MSARDDEESLDPELLNAAVDLWIEQADDPAAALAARFPDLTEEIPAALERARRYVARVRPATLRVLGDFEVLELLGNGSTGRVYRARQRSLGGREVALKVLPRELAAQDPRFEERFRREAALAASVHHPNVAEVYGSGEHEGQLYFAMRLVEGRTLGDVVAGLAERRLRGQDSTGTVDHARRVVLVARELAGALAAIHARGLVHRDVKPSSVVMEGARQDDARGLEGRPILLDFGLLRPAEGADATHTRGLRSAAYAAPEVLLGEEIDASADVLLLPPARRRGERGASPPHRVARLRATSRPGCHDRSHPGGPGLPTRGGADPDPDPDARGRSPDGGAWTAPERHMERHAHSRAASAARADRNPTVAAVCRRPAIQRDRRRIDPR